MKFSLKKKITDFHYKKSSILLFCLLFIPAVFYFTVIVLKNFLYKINLLKEKKVSAFVICVGNLTTGGVGKTPVVIELANYFSKFKKTAVLSRGYGGKTKSKKPLLVKNYNQILVDDPKISGDEINLIAHLTNNTAIAISPNRVLGAEFLIKELGAEIIIMDDGFSNRKIKKDFNLVLIDSKNTFGNGFILPLGPLREPFFEIYRADSILFVQKDEISKNTNKLKEIFKKRNIPYYSCKMSSGEIYNLKTKNILSDKKIIAFSGIGQPEQFYSKLKNLDILKTISFDDHINYNQKIIDEINNEIKRFGANAAVTTEKDMVKLTCFNNINKFYALPLKVEIDLDEIFKKLLKQI